MAGVNSRLASVSETIFNGFLLKMLMRSQSTEYNEESTEYNEASTEYNEVSTKQSLNRI